jgi:hypothetical protein
MVLVGLDVDSLSVGMLNSTGDGAEGKRIAQDFATGLKTSGLQQKHKGGPTRVEGDTVFESSVVTDFLLAHTDNTLLTSGDIVTVETAGLHEFKSFLLTFLRNGVGGLNIVGHISSVLKPFKAG